MNAKSKFSIPILSGTRPEVGLFSATVAAPSLRNASNLVAGVAVSNYPMVTTSATSNNSIVPANLPINADYRYPGTNAILASQGGGQLVYMDASKKTIQLDYSQDVTGPIGVGVLPQQEPSQMMAEYLKTGKLEGRINSGLNVSGVLSTSTNSKSLISGGPRIAAELYDCSPQFNNVAEVELVVPGLGYATFISGAFVRMVYFTNKNGITGTVPTGFIIGGITSNGTVSVIPESIRGQTLIDQSIENIPVDAILTVEDGQIAATGDITVIDSGSGYTSSLGLLLVAQLISQGPNPSSVSGRPGQGLQLNVVTNASGEITAINSIVNPGSGYSDGDRLALFEINLAGELIPNPSGAIIEVVASSATTLAQTKVTRQYLPGSGAPIGPFDSFTVESIELPNGTIKHLPLNSDENICQSKVPKARIFTAGGAKAYYPQISSGLQPTNWNVGNGAARCANPTLCLPVGISSQNGQTIVNGVPV